jgi:hypothetical protein
MEQIRSRRLRKYEAQAEPLAPDHPRAGETGLECFSPFGPMIARLRVPDDLVRQVNRYADDCLVDGRGGELLLPESLVTSSESESLASVTARLIQRYLARLEGTEVSSVRFEQFWVVSQYSGSPSPVHFHSGDLSGVLYLKVPELDPQGGEHDLTYISGRQAGYINFLSGGKQRFAKSLISFKPRVGDFYVFPGWLLHVAEPFEGRGERRSMAFNAFVQDGE